MIDALYSYWAFNNVDFATDLQYSVSIYFLQNIFKVHCTIGFNPQDMRQLLNHAWSTFSWCYCGTSIHFLMPLFFFFFLEPFYFAGSKELFHFAGIRKLFHQGTTQFFFFFFGTRELLHFARTMARTRELLSFFEIKELLHFCWISV